MAIRLAAAALIPITFSVSAQEYRIPPPAVGTSPLVTQQFQIQHTYGRPPRLKITPRPAPAPLSESELRAAATAFDKTLMISPGVLTKAFTLSTSHLRGPMSADLTLTSVAGLSPNGEADLLPAGPTTGQEGRAEIAIRNAQGAKLLFDCSLLTGFGTLDFIVDDCPASLGNCAVTQGSLQPQKGHAVFTSQGGSAAVFVTLSSRAGIAFFGCSVAPMS